MFIALWGRELRRISPVVYNCLLPPRQSASFLVRLAQNRNLLFLNLRNVVYLLYKGSKIEKREESAKFAGILVYSTLMSSSVCVAAATALKRLGYAQYAFFTLNY